MITLKTLPQATAQEIFDQVKEHLLKQNKKAHTLGGTCQYLNDAGLKCAAGCFIGLDEYKPVFEYNTWSDLVGSSLVPDSHSNIICMAQNIHDFSEVENWPLRLEEMAKELNLRF